MTAMMKAAFSLALLGVLYSAAMHFVATHDEAFTDQGLLERDASDLTETIVTPYLETPVESGKSVLWCGSFQLAWNEACSLVGENLRFENEPPMVRMLNQKSFTKEHIDPESYVALAGFVKDDVFGQITQQLRDTFKGQAVPRYIPPRGLTPRPQDIVAYSYLFKNLEFELPFERIPKPIVFGTDEVPCFGIGEERKAQHFEMLKQFVILDYQSEDDLIVEFKTKSEQDRVILAKIQPEPTLDATVNEVQKRAAKTEPTQPQSGDVLKVPKLNFDITRRFTELEGKWLLHNNRKVASDLMILSALQNIRYQFDEKGVRLRSESHISFGCSATAPPPPAKHVMVFDKPFLIMLRRKEAAVPYFVLWIGNAEVLVKVER